MSEYCIGFCIFHSAAKDLYSSFCLCFPDQFCDSMVRPLVTINLVLASFSEGYGHSSSLLKIASSVIGSRKYILDPELRAERVNDGIVLYFHTEYILMILSLFLFVFKN